MKRSSVGLLSLLLLAPVLAAAATTATSLGEFSLKDQFNREYTQADYQGAVVLLIGADGQGAQYNEAWSKAIHGALDDHPNYAALARLPYADLRGVPFFARGYIRGLMPEDEDDPVLLDWRGRLAKRYELVRGQSNVLVFGPDGTLVTRASGTEVEPEVVEAVVEVLQKLLDDV